MIEPDGPLSLSMQCVLLAVSRSSFSYRRPRTSVANLGHRIFPSLLRGLEISRAGHVWCADITSVRVSQGGSTLRP